MSLWKLETIGRTTLGSPEFWQRLTEEPKILAAEVCYINVSQLDETLQRHSALHAWVGSAFETARIDQEKAQWELTKAKAQALLKAKHDKDLDTGKAKTVDVLQAEADLDTEVDRLQQEVFGAGKKLGALKAMEKSLFNRKDLLVEIARKQRHEQANYSTR